MFTASNQQTFGSTIESRKNFGAGFDLLRWGLAALIFVGHCKWLAGSGVPKLTPDVAHALVQQGWAGFRRPIQVSMVPMFFALSGFLVTASALRVREVRNFLTLRSLRIFPALTVEVMLSALVLGPLLTTLALSDYVSDPAFARYFGNIIGFVSFDLPGVFTRNHVPGVVNANLWTLPAEFYCYLVTAVMMATGLMFDRKTFTILFAVATSLAIAASLLFGFGLSNTTAATPLVVYYFFAGSLVYQWRDSIPRDARLFILAAAVSYGLLLFHQTAFIAPLAVVYVTVYLGLCHHEKLGVLRNADYSYGIYLYGFPITQAVLALVPELQGHGNWLALIAGTLTIFFAALSWHLIEAPMLKLKSRLTGGRKTAARQHPDRPPERAEAAA